MVTEHHWSSSTVCQLLWTNPSLSDLLGMHGPPKFDVARGDQRQEPPLTLNLVPRERTQESPGAAASSGPVRLTLGPGASLTFDLTEYPKVARMVPFTYKGHVIMYTNTKVMSIVERGNLPSTALPDFDLQTKRTCKNKNLSLWQAPSH